MKILTYVTVTDVSLLVCCKRDQNKRSVSETSRCCVCGSSNRTTGSVLTYVRCGGASSGQLQHVMLGQDPLSLCVDERQGVDDDAQHGRRLPLALHAHQLQEEASVGEGVEDELCGLTEQPGVVRRQRHPVGVSEGRTWKWLCDGDKINHEDIM